MSQPLIRRPGCTGFITSSILPTNGNNLAYTAGLRWRRNEKRKRYGWGGGQQWQQRHTPGTEILWLVCLEGITRYNQLFTEIMSEREKDTYPYFENYCIKEFKKEQGQNKHKQNKVENDKPLPSTKHELWDDDSH
jgi:hypothetical protein